MSNASIPQIAVIGAGLVGASCARALADAGLGVHLFDKSRGVGGRLATRRLHWAGQQGQAQSVEVDRGAVGFQAQALAFQAFAKRHVERGVLALWQPKLAPEGLHDAHAQASLYLPAPHMPTLCRHLLEGLPQTLAWPVDSLHRVASVWLVQADHAVHPAPFDAVLLALPQAQASALLGPHRADWARHAAVTPMAPWVQAELQAALEHGVGQSLRWQHLQVHRWRCALLQPARSVPAPIRWWDADLGLGLCGDFIGGAGAEGAWLSAQSLGAAVLATHPAAVGRWSSSVARLGLTAMPFLDSVQAVQSLRAG